MNWILDHLAQLLTVGGVVWTAVLGIINKHQITEVHLTMNSRFDAYLKAVGEASHLKGITEERARADTQAAAEAKGRADAITNNSGDVR